MTDTTSPFMRKLITYYTSEQHPSEPPCLREETDNEFRERIKQEINKLEVERIKCLKY
jgi:hypothetical protein